MRRVRRFWLILIVAANMSYAAPLAYDVDGNGCSVRMHQRLIDARSAAMEVNEQLVDSLLPRPDTLARTACSQLMSTAADLLTQLSSITTFSATDAVTTAMMSTIRSVLSNLIGGVCGALTQMVNVALKPAGRLREVSNLGSIAYGLYINDVNAQVNNALSKMNLQGVQTFQDVYLDRPFQSLPVSRDYPEGSFLSRAKQKVESWWQKKG